MSRARASAGPLIYSLREWKGRNPSATGADFLSTGIFMNNNDCELCYGAHNPFDACGAEKLQDKLARTEKALVWCKGQRSSILNTLAEHVRTINVDACESLMDRELTAILLGDNASLIRLLDEKNGFRNQTERD